MCVSFRYVYDGGFCSPGMDGSRQILLLSNNEMGLGFVSMYVNLSIVFCLLATWSPGCSTAVLTLQILCEALPLDEWLRLPW